MRNPAIHALFLTAALLPCCTSPQVPATADTIITGTVVDSHGSPVANANVRFFPFAGTTGMLNLDTTTASDGSFVLKLRPFGKGIISAFKTTAGFPDAELALYGRWTYPSLAQIDATAGANIHVDLNFSEPDALIEWTVMSKVEQTPIPNARYTIEWIDDSKIMASYNIPENGFFRFILPKHPVVIRIEAPGFKDWTSKDPGAFAGPLLLEPGAVDRRSIMLDPK